MVLSMSRWLGKVAIVTGASSGIGAAIVDALVAEGLIVVGLARRAHLIEEKAKKLSNEKGKLYAVKVDMTREEDILTAFKWVTENLGPVHVLINNAGFWTQGLVTEGKTDDWRRIFDTNVIGLCIATREAVRIMKENGVSGHIVHINSIAGHRVPMMPRGSVYPASKHAITALTEIARQEFNLSNSKIKISSVSPGLTVSELTTLNENLTDDFRKNLESRPILQPEDVADGVVYVLSTPEHVQVHELIIKPIGEPY